MTNYEIRTKFNTSAWQATLPTAFYRAYNILFADPGPWDSARHLWHAEVSRRTFVAMYKRRRV